MSFNQVRTLLPTRFRLVDADGKDIGNPLSVNACKGETAFTSTPAHSTRVEYGKPISGSRGEDDAASDVAEQSAVYRVDTCKYQVMAL